MAYTVLARRYRSDSFGGVIGQEPVAQTLRNAIAQNRVAHAYLFTGTRGVGKTSMARLFARALNAPDTLPDAPKPESAADGASDNGFPPLEVQQRMADAIMRGDDLNVIEIDGASNNSVDQARQLIANAGLSPTGNARYKVYIIDEVHMLSGAAFNALLKTMEEPPPHVKFILCTTEAHKVPATIQSRCQRFDFRNIPVARIADHLRNVLRNEGIEADEEVIFQVARLANGSMRDGLSLLDRLIAAGQSPLTPQVLEEMFGLPDHQLVSNLIDALAGGDIKASLERTADLLNHGIGQDQLVEVLIERLRQLMLIAACGPDSDLVELSEVARAQAAEQAKRFDAPALTYMIALLENLARAAKSSSSPRALLDAAIVRLALAEKMADVTALLSGTGPVAGGVQKKKVAAAEMPRPVTARPSPADQNQAQGQGHHPPVPAAPADDEPAATIPATAAPSPDAGDVDALWAAVIADLSARPSAAWLRFLTLQRIDGDTAIVAPKPGHREVQAFATPARLEPVAAALSRLRGRRTQVMVQSQGDGRAGPDSRPPASADGPRPGAQAAGGMGDGRPDGATAGAGAGAAGFDRRAAMKLPLVRQAMEFFPDATVIDAREERRLDEAGDTEADESRE